MKRTITTLAAAALLLAGCSSADTADVVASTPSAANPTAQQTATYLHKEIGEESFVTDPATGKDTLTFTVDSIDRANECLNLYDKPVQGEFVKLAITAKSDGLDALDGNVISPEKWSAVTETGQELRGITSSCVGTADLLSIDEVGTRVITAHFTAPADAVAIRVSSEVDRGGVRGWEWTLPSPDSVVEVTTTPEVQSTTQSATQSAELAPPIGFTGAPIGDPAPLTGKVIDFCMEPPNYQNGTTMFTDGTTGWTQECAG